MTGIKAMSFWPQMLIPSCFPHLDTRLMSRSMVCGVNTNGHSTLSCITLNFLILPGSDSCQRAPPPTFSHILCTKGYGRPILTSQAFTLLFPMCCESSRTSKWRSTLPFWALCVILLQILAFQTFSPQKKHTPRHSGP